MATAAASMATRTLRDASRKSIYMPKVKEIGACCRIKLTDRPLGQQQVSHLLAKVQAAQLNSSLASLLLSVENPPSKPPRARPNEFDFEGPLKKTKSVEFAGCDLAQLVDEPSVNRAKYFQQVANLMQTLASGTLPAVFAVDGILTGCAVGLAAHSRFFVATERTRLALPGPAFGFVPESFATYQLSRLPGALGIYLALTGAALTGQELRRLGLATHYTESQTLRHFEQTLSEQVRIGPSLVNQMLFDLCVEPAPMPSDESHAMFYTKQIEECFSGDSLQEIMASLGRGKTLWHEQVKMQLEQSAPLALQLTFSTLKQAQREKNWSRCLQEEAELCGALMQTADFKAGFKQLMAARRLQEETLIEVPVWEHQDIAALPDSLLMGMLPSLSGQD